MKKMAKCNVCGRVHNVNEMYKVVDRITKYSYQCERCYHAMRGYSVESTQFKTEKTRKYLITIGMEHEFNRGLTRTQLNATRILGKYGYIPSEDCTAAIEWKSPVYRNLNGIAKLLYSVYEQNNIELDESVGTHVNVWSEELSARDWKRIQNYYNIIFKPLYDTIMNDSQAYKLFGRNPNRWCNGFGLYHETLINMQNDKIEHPRIELRIAKYHDNEQFMNTLKFASDFMKTILVNFSKNYMSDADAFELGKTSEYASKHNEHKAQVTANKLVKVYAKYRGL